MKIILKLYIYVYYKCNNIILQLFIQLLEQRLQHIKCSGNNSSNNNNEFDKRSHFQELKELILKLSVQSHKTYISG